MSVTALSPMPLRSVLKTSMAEFSRFWNRLFPQSFPREQLFPHSIISSLEGGGRGLNP